MPLSTLEHCPVCAHDLTDRAPPNRCPQCGFEYDENTRVWRSSQSWPRLAVIYAAVGFILGLMVAALDRLGAKHATYPILPILGALVAPAIGLLFRRIIGGRISGRFVALTPRGILVGTRSRPLLVPWTDYDRLGEQRGVPKLYRHAKPLLIPLDDIFANPAELVAFRDALKEAARRYRQASGPHRDK